ncbi:MAG TPA: hypothetical protein VKA80_14795 [Beijerinckiaceae bacterium]|nr:hypothetical protein [Beijerinckiaceae bacterium]
MAKADAGARLHELARDHADEGIGDGELRAGEEPGRGGRQHDAGERLRPGELHHPRRAQEGAGHARESIESVDRDRHHG